MPRWESGKAGGKFWLDSLFFFLDFQKLLHHLLILFPTGFTEDDVFIVYA